MFITRILFISLGPGDGTIDQSIMSHVTNPKLSYIPVDISDYFLNKSYKKIRNIKKIPISIQCDFEENINFVRKHIDLKRHKKIIWSLLGKYTWSS